MQGATTEIAYNANSSAASNGIRIDRVLLLTGMIGLLFLMLSWTGVFCAVFFVGFGAYSAIVGNMGDALYSIVNLFACAIVWSIFRWVARGLLEGRKARAIVACILMVFFALLFALFAYTGALMPSGNAIYALVMLTLSALLIASFRNRPYWGRGRVR